MADWKEVADSLDVDVLGGELYNAAIRLCELAARLPPGEAERVLEQAVREHKVRTCAHLWTVGKQDHSQLVCSRGCGSWRERND